MCRLWGFFCAVAAAVVPHRCDVRAAAAVFIRHTYMHSIVRILNMQTYSHGILSPFAPTRLSHSFHSAATEKSDTIYLYLKIGGASLIFNSNLWYSCAMCTLSVCVRCYAFVCHRARTRTSERLNVCNETECGVCVCVGKGWVGDNELWGVFLGSNWIIFGWVFIILREETKMKVFSPRWFGIVVHRCRCVGRGHFKDRYFAQCNFV